jgi:gluconolactonase
MPQTRPLLALLLLLSGAARLAAADPLGPVVPTLIGRIRGELAGPLTDDSKPRAGVPPGTLLDGTMIDSVAYPGTQRSFRVYVPAQYDPARPACLIICLDGIPKNAPTVFDNLIAAGQMPVTIAVGLSSGSVGHAPDGTAVRWDRSYEFDSTNGKLAGFVIDELLPRVEAMRTADGRPIHLSKDPKDRAAMGASTGGIGSFTLAWERPDSFSRVYSMIGTFVSMRGGHDYPALIRKVEPKPIRVFLEDGSTDAWNPLFESWFMANVDLEAALTFAGYDVEHAWGVHGHDGGPGNVILPDVMRWLWRGWPAAVPAGRSANDMLAAIVPAGTGWERVGGPYAAVAGLAGNARGDVVFSDPSSHTLYRVGADGKPAIFLTGAPEVEGEAFGPDGTLYATVPSQREVVAFDPQGGERTVTGDLRGSRLLVTAANELYVSEPGAHSDEPSRIWRVQQDGRKLQVDRGLLAASGLAFSPDGRLFLAAEHATARVTTYIVRSDRALEDREPFYWLHAADSPGDAGSGDLALDVQGTLYVATRSGVQVCDRNGRVRAILWLPTPAGPTEGLCWGGEKFDILYATDGQSLYRRKLKVAGYPQWAAPIVLPKANAG